MSDSGSQGKSALYRYVPSLVGAILFVALFLVVSIVHAWKMAKTKTWYFFPMFLGGIFEAIGFIGRIYGHYDQQQLGAYIIQTLFILIAPSLFSASIYIILGRIITFTHGEKYAIVRTSRLTKVFVAGDVLSFFVQSGGGGIMASKDPSKRDLGEKIVLVGLFIQIIWFGVFVIASLRFHYGIAKRPTNESESLLLRPPEKFSWRTMLMTLYLSSALIMIRSIFRVIEYIGGRDGYLMSTEAYFYVLDAALMFLVLAIFVVVHPSNVFSNAPADYSMTSKLSRGSPGV